MFMLFMMVAVVVVLLFVSVFHFCQPEVWLKSSRQFTILWLFAFTHIYSDFESFEAYRLQTIW